MKYKVDATMFFFCFFSVAITKQITLLACIMVVLFVFDAFKLFTLEQITLLRLTIVIPLIFVFVFGDCFEDVTNTTLISRIVIKIIKLTLLIDIIDIIVDTGIIFNTIVDAAIKIEIVMAIWIVYLSLFIINGFMTILRLISAAVYLIVLLFAVIDLILPAKEQNKVKKQS